MSKYYFQFRTLAKLLRPKTAPENFTYLQVQPSRESQPFFAHICHDATSSLFTQKPLTIITAVKRYLQIKPNWWETADFFQFPVGPRPPPGGPPRAREGATNWVIIIR